MAVKRERPYVQFNFLVDLGDGNTDGPDAGFQEISGIGMEVTVAEYRPGNKKENSVMKNLRTKSQKKLLKIDLLILQVNSSMLFVKRFLINFKDLLILQKELFKLFAWK